MTLKIQPLPIEVVHLIAAGEVIDSLAAVVRELAENAIDAGASRLTGSLYPEQWQIRVADNGSGMELADLRQAAAPHSTSKIASGDDLWRITSLGFRGEALHSLAQLATLEICSRRESIDSEASQGWRVLYNSQGEAIQVETVAIAPGTIVTVSNLFGDWLARRQGLPSLPQQMRTVQMVIQSIALCHPAVTWQVEQNDRPWFTLYPGTTAKQLLPQILRDINGNDLQELSVELKGESQADGEEIACPKLYVLLGLPDRCHRHRPDWVRVAVNHRFVKLPELEQVILRAFRRTLPRDRYPVCLVHLHAPPAQVDWNRHPAKAEIYLHLLDYWQEQIAQTIAQALSLSAATGTAAQQSERVGQLLKTAESQGEYHTNRSVQPDGTGSLPFMSLKALAQVHQMYILAEHPTGMWLIEQHIAHERVLYEQLCDRWQLVPLDPPIILDHLSPNQVEQLQGLQIQVESFGDQLWVVRNAPQLLAQREDCPEALVEISLGGLEAALVATACRSAIRNGTALTLEDMQTLLNQWQQTRNPRTCPHGRPIYLPLEESSLSRFFRRHWVIGKSHGI